MARVGTKYIGIRITQELHDILHARAAEESAVSGAPHNVSEIARAAIEAGLGMITTPQDAGYQAGKRLGYAEAARKLSEAYHELPDGPGKRRG